MIEVRIRNAEDAEATIRLCTWPADNLDTLLPTLRSWGVLNANGVRHSGTDADITGQFVVDNESAYFEVVIHDKDDG